MEEQRKHERTDHTLTFIRKYWFLALLVMGMATLYFKVVFVTNAVTPETMTAFELQQQKNEIRWCITKAYMIKDHTIGCAD